MLYSALFAALIFAGTQFVRVPLPFGYFNLGDCFVLLCAELIGGPYAVIAAAIGAALSDVLSGYTIYAPATLIIKSLMVVVMMLVLKLDHSNGKGIKLPILIAGAVISELLMIGGYFITDIILYRVAGAVASLPGNILQGVAAVITSVLIIKILETGGLMRHIKLSDN